MVHRFAEISLHLLTNHIDCYTSSRKIIRCRIEGFYHDDPFRDDEIHEGISETLLTPFSPLSKKIVGNENC